MTIERGDVILVTFPYLDTSGIPQGKARPALVLSGRIVHDHTADVIIAAISSRPASHPLPTDVHIPIGSPEHKAAGLKVNSWIKVATLAAVPKAAVSRRLGRLDAVALSEVEKRLRLALELGGP